MAENGLPTEPDPDAGRSDGGVAWWDSLKERSFKALPAYAMSLGLAVLFLTGLLLVWRPRDWHDFMVNVTSDIAGGVAVAFALTPAFLAIRHFANDKFGRTQDFERFPYSEFIERLTKCDDLVRIMDTCSYVVDLETAAAPEEVAERRRCVAMLREVLGKRNNVGVEVLLVDPTSAAARQRSADLASQNLDIAAGVDRNLALLNKIRLELPRGARQKLLVKLYNSTPTCAYYRVDERTSIAFYALQKPTEQGAHVDVALKSVLGKIVNDHFREIRDHAHSVDFLEYLYGSTAVDGHREQVGWTEAQDRLYLAVGDPKENPVTWLAAPSTAGAVGLAFSGYKRAAADFIVSRVIPWNQDTGLARQTLAKYGVEFEFFFELEPTRVGRRANRRPSGEW